MLVGHKPFNGKSMDELFQKVKNGTYSLPLSLSKEVVSFINGMLQQDPNKRLTANQLLYHDFLRKHPSQFQSVDVREIGSIGPGGVINMKSNTQPTVTIGNDEMELWGIFTQPGRYLPGVGGQNVTQVQPVMQLPVQQYTYMTPQQQNYYVNPSVMAGW